MARPEFIPGRLDPLRGFQVGRQQRAQKVAEQQRGVQLGQAQQRLNQVAQQQQFEQQEATRQAAIDARSRQLDEMQTAMVLGQETGDLELYNMAAKGVGDILGIEIAGDPKDVTQAIINIEKETDPTRREILANRFEQRFTRQPEAEAARLERLGFLGGVTRRREQRETISEEQRIFELQKGRQEQLREEVGARVEAVLPKGLDEQTKAIIKLASQGDLTASAAQQLLKGTGINIRSGLAGPGGTSVTKIFDDTGKTIAEFPEAPAVTKEIQPKIQNIPTGEFDRETGAPITKPMLLRQVDGEFTLTPVPIQGLEAPSGIAPELAPAAGGTLAGFPEQRGQVLDTTQKATPAETQAAIEESKRKIKGIVPLKEGGRVGPPLSPKAEKLRDIKFKTTLHKLGKIETVQGAPTQEEYLEDVFSRNVDIDGKLLVSEKEILNDYKKIVNFHKRRAQLGAPTPLEEIPAPE
jgi:hypothetical protein